MFISIFLKIFRPNVQSDINKHKFDMPTYLNSFVPAVDWLLKDAANKASEAQLNDILCQCCKKQNK